MFFIGEKRQAKIRRDLGFIPAAGNEKKKKQKGSDPFCGIKAFLAASENGSMLQIGLGRQSGFAALAAGRDKLFGGAGADFTRGKYPGHGGL